MSYRIVFLSSMLFVLNLCPAPPTVYAQGCSPEQRVELLRNGYSREEVDSICGSPMDRPQQNYPPPSYPGQQPYQQVPQMGSVCVTNFGTCPMMQPLPIGVSCVCYTAYGAIPGYVQ